MQAHAFGFDFDHTLGVDNQLEIVAFLRLARDIGARNRRPVDEERASIAIVQALDAFRRGRATLEGAIAGAIEQTFGERLDTHAAVGAFCNLAVELVPQCVRPMPGVRELLASLDAASISYAILTNGWNPLQQRKADFIGFRKPVLVSGDLGVRKPSAQAFDALRERLGVAAQHVWYVGDDPKIDVVGSLSAGMKAIWFDGTGARYPTDMPGPTAIVRHITEVLRYIK